MRSSRRGARDPAVARGARRLRARADVGDREARLRSVPARAWSWSTRSCSTRCGPRAWSGSTREGKPFDPERHEALIQTGEGDGEPVVADVLRPGYTFKGRVLRPAGVRVHRGREVPWPDGDPPGSGSTRTTTRCSACPRTRREAEIKKAYRKLAQQHPS